MINKRKIILNLAISLDGYISDNDGGYAWITGDGNRELKTDNEWDYNKFLEDIDTVVMGKNCYTQGFHNDFKDKTVFVATHEKLKDYDNIKFIDRDICDVILKEANKHERNKNIFLFGGGLLIDAFIKQNIIDEYIIGVIPTILGSGRKLFLDNNPTINLSLTNYYVEEGTVIMKYIKR